MAKDITGVVEKSENKKIQTTVDREFFILYCEENDQLKKSMDDLVGLRDTTEDDRVRADIDKYIISQIIGNAKQATEIGSVGGVEIIVKSGTLDDKNKDKTDKS